MSNQNVASNVSLNCLIKMFHQNVLLKCLIKISNQNVSSKCIITFSHKNFYFSAFLLFAELQIKPKKKIRTNQKSGEAL